MNADQIRVQRMMSAVRQMLEKGFPPDIPDAEMQRIAGDPEPVNVNFSDGDLPADAVIPPAVIGASSQRSRFENGIRH